MLKPTSPSFAARTATSGIAGLRAVLEAPETATGSNTAPAILPANMLTKDDLTRQLEDFDRKMGTKLAEEREKTIARVNELDAEIKKLKATGTQGAVRSRFFAGLATGDPSQLPRMRADESVEERIERAREEASTRFIRVNGERVPVIHSIPRGVSGLQDGRGLLAMRIMRAVALCTAYERGITPDNALAMSAKFFGANDDATGYLEEARDVIKKMDGSAPDERQRMERALGTSVLGAGAGFVMPQLWGTFFDFLFPKSVLHRLGAGQMPLETSMLFSFFDTAVTASYVGDNAGVNEGTPNDGQFQINGKTLQVICALANKLLESSSFAVDAILRQHMAKAMAAKGDLKGIEGRGNSFDPHGLDFWVEQPSTAHFGNRTLAAGVPTYATIIHDILAAVEVITNENLEMAIEPNTDGGESGVMPGIILQNRDAIGLMRIITGVDSRQPFAIEMRGGTVQGLRWAATTQTTKTGAGDGAGAGTNNKSNAYVGDFGMYKEAIRDSLQLETFRGGAYKDANGNVVSGITNRETVFQGALEHEWVEVYRGKGQFRIQSVDWGVQF